jgi:hypothetical protein
MSVKRLWALLKLGLTGVKHEERRQDRLAVCGRVSLRWMCLLCFSAAPFWCEQGLGGIVFLVAVVLCLPKGCGR